ncbi:hypothetical protein [Flavobacterium pectinovorum]|uniref:hypothetical protein n=1 Tax=Flavobacterium pectinovorum TaxID=29533 RepID=UPI001FAC1EA8|nr:hypothetical protein [Flavobacterium pectinovorum]MCI9846551.1 hypothetical protein [Flavobacterium pectinovorum]
MNFRFTKYAFTNALWTLIPIFPIFSIFPCVLLALGIEKITHNCEISYTIVLWFSILFILLTSFLFFRKLDSFLLNEKTIRQKFMSLNFTLYILLNTVIYIIMLGVNVACHGDGQTALMTIVSGPISSLLLIVFGFFIDLR